MAEITEIRCLNKVQLREWRVFWTIQDFSTVRSVTPQGQSLNSSKFRAGFSSGNEWYLSLYPKGKCYYESNVGVHLIATNAVKTPINFSVCIINGKHEKCNYKTFDHSFSGSLSCGSDQFIPFSCLTDSAKGLLVNNSLTLCCEIKFYGIVSNRPQVLNLGPNVHNLFKDFSKLYNQSILTDVKIVVGDQKFQAHKAILAARSPVFAAMFNHNMKENCTDIVNITDIEPKIMNAILYYMYSNECPKLNEMAVDLLSCADKYDIKELKKMAEEYLFSNLTISNAVSRLLLANRCNSEHLKSESVKFIISNGKDVVQSNDWTCLATDGNLSFVLLTTLLTKFAVLEKEILLG